MLLPMSLLEQKSPESVAGVPFGNDTCHRNTAETCQVYTGKPCGGGIDGRDRIG